MDEKRVEKRIMELLELRGFLLYDLKWTNRYEEKFGDNEHLAQMRDKFLDQLNDIDKELKELNR